MKIGDLPFTLTKWDDLSGGDHPGETGTSSWRIFEGGDVRVRVVECSPGYKSDHWCSRGHVLYVLDGEFGVELRDGRNVLLGKGMSFQVGDDEANPHLGYSERGAKVFIVD